MSKRMEEVIAEKLTGDTRQNALDFATYMTATEMPPVWNDGTWMCCFQGRPVCVVYITGGEQAPGPWTIWHSGYDPKYPPAELPAGEDADTVGLCDVSADEMVKQIAWEHINICGKCGCGRQPGRRTMVFGKEFDNVCTSTLTFTNPDARTLECVKKLAELMKQGIAKLA